MEHQQFEIIISDFVTSIDGWRRARQAPRSELPKLNQEQKEVARKFKISQEEYARGVLAGLYGQERMRARAQKLGEEIERILPSLGQGYRVAAVVAEMFKGRWLIRVRTSERTVNVAVPRELGDDVLDSGVREEVERLKNCVAYGLGLETTTRDPR